MEVMRGQNKKKNVEKIPITMNKNFNLNTFYNTWIKCIYMLIREIEDYLRSEVMRGQRSIR